MKNNARIAVEYIHRLTNESQTPEAEQTSEAKKQGKKDKDGVQGKNDKDDVPGKKDKDDKIRPSAEFDQDDDVIMMVVRAEERRPIFFFAFFFIYHTVTTFCWFVVNV